MFVVSTMGSGDLGRKLDLDSVTESLVEAFDIGANRHGKSMVTIRLELEGLLALFMALARTRFGVQIVEKLCSKPKKTSWMH
jgi:hypothetical protein